MRTAMTVSILWLSSLGHTFAAHRSLQGRIEKALQLASHMLDARNPFAAASPGGGPSSRVVAIEVCKPE